MPFSEENSRAMAKALRVLAEIPIEDFSIENQLDRPIVGWNGHLIYVRDVLEARRVLKQYGRRRMSNHPTKKENQHANKGTDTTPEATGPAGEGSRDQ